MNQIFSFILILSWKGCVLVLVVFSSVFAKLKPNSRLQNCSWINQLGIVSGFQCTFGLCLKQKCSYFILSSLMETEVSFVVWRIYSCVCCCFFFSFLMFLPLPLSVPKGRNAPGKPVREVSEMQAHCHGFCLSHLAFCARHACDSSTVCLGLLKGGDCLLVVLVLFGFAECISHMCSNSSVPLNFPQRQR